MSAGGGAPWWAGQAWYCLNPTDIAVNVASSASPIWIDLYQSDKDAPGATVRLTAELADKLLSQLATCIAMHEEDTGETRVLQDMIGRLMPLLREEVKESERGQAGD